MRIFARIFARVFVKVFDGFCARIFWGVPNRLLGSAKISPRNPLKFSPCFGGLLERGLGGRRGEMET